MRALYLVTLAVALLPLALWGNELTAQQSKNQQAGMRHDRLESMATQLGLDAKQKEQIQKICTSFDEKERPLDHQLWTLWKQEYDAALQVLKPDQRSKVPEVLKEEREKELDKIGAKLGLSNDQKQKIKEICEKYQPRFQELTKESNENAFHKMHELREEVFAAVRPILTEDQRAKVPGIMREELEMWHDPSAQSGHVRAIEDRLGLDANQREQLQKIMTDCNQKSEKPRTELRQVHQQEQAAIEQVLNDQQRTKLREIMKVHGK